MAAAKKNGFDIILSSFKSKCSDLLESDSTFHESITAVNEHLQTESAETTGMTGEDKVAVKVITLMLPALEVLITSKQDDRLNKHDVAINKLQAQVRNVLYENDSLNQYSRRENVRISNVPEADGEDLTNILIEIAGSGCEGSQKERSVEINSKSENLPIFISESDRQNCEIQNVKGQLKVLSLNVCGLVSKSKIPDFVEFISSYDILCFTESKFDAYDDVHLSGYELLPPIIREKCRHKSGGIAVFVKSSIYKYVKVIDISSQCIYLFSIVNLLPSDLLFGIVYIPPENSVYGSVDIFDEILEKIIDITVNKNYQVCLLGDFNAHTGTHDDFIIVNDTILDSLLIDENSRKYMNSINALYELGIPIKRSSKDISNINNYGHKLLEFCKNLDLYIVNGRISNDQLVGAVTTSKNTLIDYAIVSPMLFKCISYFNIENFDPILSDIHCPVVIHFDTSVILESVDTLSHDDNSNVVYKPKWKNNNANVFLENLNDENIHDLVEKLENLDVNNINVETVNNVILNCNSIIKNAADKADMIVEFKPKNSRPGVRSKKCKPYFNQDCYLKRKAYRKCKNLHWRLQRAETKENLIASSREYKRTLKVHVDPMAKMAVFSPQNFL
ncbi:unnamed protein product [Mytilus edulis]|uniref:Endonuclease/exonuclease/phosphatase domain-containing protein n=1 Tax=Mytilus edulis TaxID=6550 RepID=A0A8S3V892_MYTED|nr:unnamed protein product [Mytilus edulis]